MRRIQQKLKARIKEQTDKDIKEHIEERRKWIIRITDKISTHFIRAFLLLLLFGAVTAAIGFINTTLFLIFSVLLSVFSLLYAIALLRKGLRVLFDNKGKLYQLIMGYAIALIGIMFFFATVYGVVHELDKGYLTYGKCSGLPVTHAMIVGDTEAITGMSGTFYFSAITFFTVGYGDICPMGWDKGIAIINGFSGAVFSTIILGIAIAKYLEHHR